MIPLVGAKSDFSLGESIVSTSSLVKQAADAGYTAIALADTMGINGLTTLFSSCKKAGIKGIIGCTFRVVDDLGWRKAARGDAKTEPNPFWMPKLYALNDAGLKDIMDLLSLSTDEAHFYGQAQIDLADLIATLDHGNVLMTTGDAHSVFSHASATKILSKLESSHSAIPFVVELSPVATAYYDKINYAAIMWATGGSAEFVISRPVLYNKGQCDPRNTLSAILARDKVDSQWREQPQEDLHIKPVRGLLAEVMAMRSRLLCNYPDCKVMPAMNFRGIIESSARFTDKFIYEWKPWDVSLPSMAADPYQALAKLCIEGWAKRITKPTLSYTPPIAEIDTYKERLKYEMTTLKAMGFENYFLLVYHIVKWSKENDIMVGPGRGSVGGSLVAFLLGITDVDPIRFGLIFERFINPDRLDLPDIDLDFMSTRRHEVIDQLVAQFGADHVAGIANYNMIGASGALRQVASAHNVPETDYRCSLQIATGDTLDQAKATIPDVEKFADKYPKVWEEACALQGVFRNYSKHAAGVIVAGEPVANRAAMNQRETPPLVNWDKRMVEDMGLIKLDVLGLSTLDLLSHAKVYIKQMTGSDLEFTDIPLGEPDIMQAFGRGDTKGVFQFEGGGMRHLLKQLAESDELLFDDIVAATALFRPGPMEAGLMDDYIQIKQGAKMEDYIHESMRPALEPTNSVIIYQEQIMQVSRDLAGFSMAEADQLRKAMGKKDPVMMAKERDKWVSGCMSTSGMAADVAGGLFDKVEKFAGYAFNKSHSVEYSILSYWAMYCKVRYPAAFYAASLTVLGEDKRTGLVKDALGAGMIVMPPDINLSSDRFEVGADGKTLYAPFQMVNGLSEKGAAAIMEAKRAFGGRFSSKAEFVATVNRRACNKTVQEKLDAVGAFATIEGQHHPLDPRRLKDQKAMLPSLIVQNVKADRTTTTTKDVAETYNDIQIKASALSEDAKKLIDGLYTVDEADEASKVLSEFGTATAYIGPKTQVMVIVDNQSWLDVNDGEMGSDEAAKPVITALRKNGISKERIYFTSLVRCAKPKGKEVSNALVNLYSPILDAELELMKPPVIVCLGGKSIRHISPEAKGKWEELAGQSNYDAKREATVIWGFSPGMVHFEPSRQSLLNDIFRQVKEIL